MKLIPSLQKASKKKGFTTFYYIDYDNLVEFKDYVILLKYLHDIFTMVSFRGFFFIDGIFKMVYFDGFIHNLNWGLNVKRGEGEFQM